MSTAALASPFTPEQEANIRQRIEAIANEPFDVLKASLRRDGMSPKEVEKAIWLYRGVWNVANAHGLPLRPDEDTRPILHCHIRQTRDFARFYSCVFGHSIELCAASDRLIYRPIHAILSDDRLPKIWNSLMARLLRREQQKIALAAPVPDWLSALAAYLLFDEGVFSGELKRTEAAIEAYFQYFCKIPFSRGAMSEDAVKVWKAHLLFVKPYYEFCFLVQGRMVHCPE